MDFATGLTSHAPLELVVRMLLLIMRHRGETRWRELAVFLRHYNNGESDWQKRRIRATAKEERPEASIITLNTEYSRHDRLKRIVADTNRLSLRIRCRDLAAES